MSIMNKSLCLVIVVSGLFVTSSAWAEPTTSVAANGDYSYRFSDEDLLGETLTNVGDMFRARHRHPRTLLLRPRTSLVGEILKSAEGL
jgi:hypothetical protein